MANSTSLNKTFNDVRTTITVGTGASDPDDVTLLNTDSGKLILVDHNHSSTLTVNIPAAEDGLNYRFVFVTKMEPAAAALLISAPAGTLLEGTIVEVNDDAADGAVSTKTADGVDDHRLLLSDDVEAGSFIDVISNGTSWYLVGAYVGNANGLAIFGAA